VDFVEDKERCHLQRQGVGVPEKTIIHETILLVKLWKPLLMSKAHDMAETILGKLKEGLAEA
jgi:hypothetical protein